MERFELFIVVVVFLLVAGFIGCTQSYEAVQETDVKSKLIQEERETPELEAEVVVIMDKEEPRKPGKMEEGVFKPKLRVHYIDVGQGDATLIQTPNKANFLIDCGSKFNYMKLRDYLKKQGVSKINALIITHPDSEHYGGCEEALDFDFVVEAVYDNGMTEEGKLYDDFLKFARKTHFQHVPFDFRLVIDPAIRSEFITAYGPGQDIEYKDDFSLIFKITYGRTSFLFMGDCEEECEEEVYRREKVSNIDVLKVGHHGGKTASNKFFLDEVRPKIAVISVGANNRERLPHQEALDRLEATETEIFRTDRNGNIIISSDGNTIKTILERQ